MTDNELLKLAERVYSNLDATCRVAVGQRDPWEDQVLDFNRELGRLIDAGFDMKEWLIPESLVKPSYGQRTLPSGEVVRLRRITVEEFLRRANPAMQYLAGEIEERRHAQAGRGSMTTKPAGDLSEVWVIYGRDEDFRRTIFSLLRAVELRPIEFNRAIARSGSGSPVVLDLILREIYNAPVIVALLSPDEHAELREELRPEPKDKPEHIQAGYQPRPNVILETGMALAALRDRTILVTKDRLREISDMGGLHEVRWENTTAKRIELVERLRGLDCPVVTAGNDWLGQT
jgi:predicted nucleotide-binding protein